jgi:hypothetical protein
MSEADSKTLIAAPLAAGVRVARRTAMQQRSVFDYTVAGDGSTGAVRSTAAQRLPSRETKREQRDCDDTDAEDRAPLTHSQRNRSTVPFCGSSGIVGSALYRDWASARRGRASSALVNEKAASSPIGTSG